MSVLISTVIPIFMIILAGYLAGQYKFLGLESSKALNSFVYWFAMPCLLFKAVATVDIRILLNASYVSLVIITVIVSMLIGLIIGRYCLKRSLSESAMLGLNAGYGNTGYLGIPLAFAAFSHTAGAPIVIYVVLSSVLTISIATIVIELSANQSESKKAVLVDVSNSVIRNPMLTAPLAGILWAALPYDLPISIANFCEMIGAAAGPCALFALGLFLVGKPLLSGFKEVSVTLVIKLLFQPLFTWFMTSYVFSLPPLWVSVAIVMASTPTGAGSFVIAHRYDTFLEETSSSIVWSSIISIVTLTWVLSYSVPH